MSETPEPEQDFPTRLRVVGKKYLRLIELSLDSVIKDMEPRVRRTRRASMETKPVVKPFQNLGIKSWLKGPELKEKTTLTQPIPGGIPVPCSNCNEPKILYAPDIEHARVLSEPCPQGDSIPANWTCRTCETKNIRYWDRLHPQVGLAKVR